MLTFDWLLAPRGEAARGSTELKAEWGVRLGVLSAVELRVSVPESSLSIPLSLSAVSAQPYMVSRLKSLKMVSK